MKDNGTLKFNKNCIEINKIFGFSEGTSSIEDHPEFPNPRRKAKRGIIDSIKQRKVFDCPITLYHHKDGAVVPLDGKTRLIAAAEYRSENPEDTPFSSVPFHVFQGSYIEARVFQIRANMDDNRSNLSEVEQALAVKSMTDDGLTKDSIMKAFGWEGKGGVRTYNSIMAVLESNPVVLEHFVQEDVTLKEATAIVGDDSINFAEQAEVVEALIEAKEQGLTPTEARKAAGVARDRTTVQSYKETLEYVCDVYSEVVSILDSDLGYGGADEKLKNILASSTKKEFMGNLETYIDERILVGQFELAMKHLRVNNNSLREKLEWVAGKLPDDVKKHISTQKQRILAQI